MIVKLQRPIEPSAQPAYVFVYSEDRSVSMLVEDGPGFDPFFARKGQEYKTFAHAVLTDDGALHLYEPADWQEW